MEYYEVNFDGLVGPSHHYGGLAYGNIASMGHAKDIADPRSAVLQGLEKMAFLHSLGVKQAIIPPLRRPNIALLEQIGYRGSPSAIIQQAAKKNPALLSVAYSAAAMWTANAATVSPSIDCKDNKVHLTTANLTIHLHRSQEAHDTDNLLKKIFADPNHFTIHPPLPSCGTLSDEGAANHMRLCQNHGNVGIEVFVFGRSHHEFFHRYPPRQTKLSQQIIADQHHIIPSNVGFIQQNPKAIEAGVFHNDVIAVSNENVILYHEEAFLDTRQAIKKIVNACSFGLHCIEITAKELSLKEAVSSYLFNSQIVTIASNKMALICPIECQQSDKVKKLIDNIIAANNPILQVFYIDCRQSMKNGGGPACLRLRVPLSEMQLANVHPGILFTDTLHMKLKNWANKNYRDRLTVDDLADPLLLLEIDNALNALEKIIGIQI